MLRGEKYSSTFSISGVPIRQTVSESFDPFSGLDVDVSSFTNTNQGLDTSNGDGRIPLGCFVFDDDNEYSDDFPNIFRDEKFTPIVKKNLVPNGDGAGVYAKWTRPNNHSRDSSRYDVTPYIPTGDWSYCTFDAIPENVGTTNFRKRDSDLYDNSNLPLSSLEESGIGMQYLLSFEQTDFTNAERFSQKQNYNANRTADYQGTTGSAGWYAYFFDYEGTLARPQAHLDLIKKGYRQATWSSGVWSYTNLDAGKMGEGNNYENNEKRTSYSWTAHKTDADEFFYRLWYDGTHNCQAGIGDGGLIPTVCEPTSGDPQTRPTKVELPNVAKWIITDEAYSHGKCLEFMAINFQNGKFYGISGTTTQTGDWDWGDKDYFHDDITHNQYRSLNQVVEIDGSQLVRYADLTIRFKMKTDSRFDNGYSDRPMVEVSMQDADGQVGDPTRTMDRVQAPDYGYYYSHVYHPQGDFNSQRCNDDLHSPGTVNRRYSGFGSMGRFQNTVFDEWEEFEYTFNNGKWHHYTSTKSTRRLCLMVQSVGFTHGRVLLDDFELIESYDFIPDCDVRKKISVAEYGKGDLTKYYDKELQPEQYKDTQGPLEAQFYFYPTYKTDKTFDVSRTPMYRDFEDGMFYIYDINWGDGSPNEFTSEPEPINEEKALYHFYDKSGIFDVTGTMIRLKPDKYGDKEIGIAKTKKFRLRININEGTAEDFEYFGSEGFSFLPIKNSTPIIGGYSEQSSYYKNIKRTLGLIDENTKIYVPFKSEGDRLKTQIAFDKMDSSFSNEFDILNEYKKQRTREDGDVIHNGLKTNTNELGKGIGDCDLTCIKYYNEPKSIWQMLGFDENDLNPGIPNHRRYWKNIIPKGYSIFNREGITNNGNIDIYSEQDWMDIDNDGVPDYYYPVLPKYGADGKFLQTTDDDGNPIVGVYPITTTDVGDFSITEEKKPYPLEAPITDENENNKNLVINIFNKKIDSNVFIDGSGNNNYGHSISDYTPKFNESTLTPQKTKNLIPIKTSTNNGVF